MQGRMASAPQKKIRVGVKEGKHSVQSKRFFAANRRGIMCAGKRAHAVRPYENQYMGTPKQFHACRAPLQEKMTYGKGNNPA
jgi:hypothetical protein